MELMDRPLHTHYYCWCNRDRDLDLTIESEHADKVDALAALLAVLAEAVRDQPEHNGDRD